MTNLTLMKRRVFGTFALCAALPLAAMAQAKNPVPPVIEQTYPASLTPAPSPQCEK